MAAALMNKPKSEMTPEELDKREEEEFNTGPLSVLTQSVKNNTQVRASKNLNTLKKYILAGNALERVQRVHESADLWDITFCTR